MKFADDNNKVSTRRARFGKKVAGPRDELTGADPALRAELVWLREENARLRMAHATQPGLHQTIARLRSATSDSVVTGPGADLAEEADQLWHVLAEAVAIKEGLLSACRDLATAAAALENRLEGLIPQFNAAQHLGEELEKLIAPPVADAQTSHVVEQPDGNTSQVIDRLEGLIPPFNAAEPLDEELEKLIAPRVADAQTSHVVEPPDGHPHQVIDLTDQVIDLTDQVAVNETSVPRG